MPEFSLARTFRNRGLLLQTGSQFSNSAWDNGFDIPQTVLDNKKCDLSIALLIFYRAGGLGSTIVVEEWEKYEKN